MATCVRAEDLLAAILSSTEDGLLSFTLDGIVQSWSRGAEFLYGYCEAEIVSEPLARLLPSNDARKFDGLLHAAIRGEFPQCENTERLHKDGSSIVLAVSRAPIRNKHGDIVGFVETAKTKAPSSVETYDDGHLKEILEQMPTVLWTTNLHLRVTSCLGAGFRSMTHGLASNYVRSEESPPAEGPVPLRRRRSHPGHRAHAHRPAVRHVAGVRPAFEATAQDDALDRPVTWIWMRRAVTSASSSLRMKEMLGGADISASANTRSSCMVAPLRIASLMTDIDGNVARGLCPSAGDRPLKQALKDVRLQN